MSAPLYHLSSVISYFTLVKVAKKEKLQRGGARRTESAGARRISMKHLIRLKGEWMCLYRGAAQLEIPSTFCSA